MVEKARALPVGSVQALIDEAPQRLAAVNGDAAQLALSAKLVDALKTRDELRQLLTERGAADNEKKSFRQVGFEDYLAHARPRSTGDAVGVIVAQGEISDGVAPAGSIGGLSTAELVRQARNDESIKAVVLRVNSPGGSAFGSELVRRELELTRAAGKPVVVSMGDVAASGGYWISLAADEVLADEATVTGSIGALMVIPNASQALDKLGVHTVGTSTGWLVGTGDVRRPTDPRFLALLQTNLDHLYKDFVGKVAQGRKTTPDKIDPVAQGRIWTGAQARERGLVDRLGGLREAVASAATLAKLGDEPRTAYIEQDPGRTARLLNLLGEPLAVGWIRDNLLPDFNLAPQVVQDAQRELSWLADLTERRKPFSAFTHCLCGDY
jgi:protease-4